VLYPFCSFFLTKESVIHYYNEILKKTGNDFRPVDYLQRTPRSWDYREKNAVIGGQGAGFEPALESSALRQ